MDIREDDENLIQGFDKNANLDIDSGNKSCNKKTIIIIISVIVLLIVILVIVLVFTVFNKNSNNENKGQETDLPTDKGRDDEDDSYQRVLDTIPQEEMDKARNAFKQFTFNDTVNKDYVLNYNLFIPENYTNEKKYPLVIFMHDASLVGSNDTNNTIIKSVGGPIWATDREQKKHQSFVLSPQYSEVIIDDNNGKYSKSEYINVTVRLIQYLIEKYPINTDRIYSTGQSMGAMTTLYLLANYQDLLAAGIVVDGQWRLDELQGLTNATFTYFAAGSDGKAFKGQTEVREYLDSLNLSYGFLNNINAQDNIDTLNNVTQEMYLNNHSYYFIKFKDGSVLPPDSKNAHEHTSSFKYGFRIDKVRDWLFEQNKVKCGENTYYSEDGKCANINFCKVTNEDLSCKECIYGFYLDIQDNICKEKEI